MLSRESDRKVPANSTPPNNALQRTINSLVQLTSRAPPGGKLRRQSWARSALLLAAERRSVRQPFALVVRAEPG